MKREEKAEGAPPWVPVARVLLAVGFLLEVVDVILRSDTGRPIGIFLHCALAAGLLVGAIVLQRLHPEKARRPSAAALSNDLRSGPNDGRQLVGLPCAECGDDIVMESSGKFCEECGVAVHTNACGRRHAKLAHSEIQRGGLLDVERLDTNACIHATSMTTPDTYFVSKARWLGIEDEAQGD